MIFFSFTFSSWQLSTVLSVGLWKWMWSSKSLRRQKESRIPVFFASHRPPDSLLVIYLYFNILPAEQVGEWFYPAGHWFHLARCENVSLTCYGKLSGNNPSSGITGATRINTAVRHNWEKLFSTHIHCVHMVGCVHLCSSISILTMLEHSPFINEVNESHQNRHWKIKLYILCVDNFNMHRNCDFYLLIAIISKSMGW